MHTLSSSRVRASLATSLLLVPFACGGSDANPFLQDAGGEASDAATPEAPSDAASSRDGARDPDAASDDGGPMPEDASRTDAPAESSAPTQCSKNGGTCELDDGTALVDPCTASGRPIGAFACQDANHICCLPKK